MMTVDSRKMPSSSSSSKPVSSPDSRSDTSEASEERIEDICRDFLRNVCKRGRRCKYRHPPANEARELGRRQEFTFCHDFQNSGCRRANCRFIHCTREEEDYYKQTGQLPVRLQQAAALGIGVVPNELPLLKGEVPICKDHLKGECKRGSRCKYRHIASTEYQAYEAPRTPVTEASYVAATPAVANGVYAATSYTEDFNGFDYEALAPKKRKLDATLAAVPPPPFNLTQPPPPIPDNTAQNHFTVTETNNNQYAHPPPAASNGAIVVPPPTTYRILRTPADYRLLEEENVMLRRKVEELKKQVSDLAATNEVLLEQNARYRSSKVDSSSGVLTTGPPIVTVSQVVTPTITPAPAVARSLQTTPTGPIGASLTTLRHITLGAASSDMIVSQALQSARLTNDLNQTANIAAAAGLNIVPVTNSIESLTGAPPAVSLGATQIAPVSIPAAAAQTSMPHTLVSGPSTHLVSYPIMSHSITQIPNTSLTQLPNTSLG